MILQTRRPASASLTPENSSMVDITTWRRTISTIIAEERRPNKQYAKLRALLNFTAGLSAVTNYTRKLDLTNSVTSVTYVQDNVSFTREALLIISSWGGTHPPNLQGIWNEQLAPDWDSKFTTKINLEMNYWGAEVANLADLVEPLLRLVEDVAVTGARTAQVIYNAAATAVTTGGGPGMGAPWVLHHNTDQWRATAPMDAVFYGMWPTGGAFELQTLRSREYHGAAGISPLPWRLSILPGNAAGASESHRLACRQPVAVPGHGFGNINDENTSINLGVTMDNSLLRDLFQGNRDSRKRFLRSSSAPPAVFTHISPLYALFPGNQIGPFINQTVSDAAEVLLIFRGESTNGWPAAWRVGTWARLLNAEHVRKDIKNLGGLGTILETLLQSQGGEIHLLPAVPGELSTSSFSGLRARRGLRVDAAWADGVLSSANIASKLPTSSAVTLRLSNSTKPWCFR
ncbi:Six-hairpin glycosidase-like protein [Mycena sp. CBHHK59/15]|nr:Six-hairpin glycosidase-like protein [Mycena sp. CBHHK59/15]